MAVSEERSAELTIVLFFVLIIAWGLNYLFVPYGLAVASPLWLAWMRAAVGAVGVMVIVRATSGYGTLDARGRRDAILIGLPNTAIFYALWFTAARTIAPGETAVVVYTFPLWVALLSGPLLASPVARAGWAGIAAGFAGVVLISQPWTASSHSGSVLASLELLAAAICWAIGTVLFQRRFRPSEAAEANSFQFIGGVAGLSVMVVALAPTPLPQPTVQLGITLLWLGVIGTAIGYAIWFDLLSRTPAATLSAYVFLVPVVALVASLALGREHLDPVGALGVLLVLVGVYIIGRYGPRPRGPANRGSARSVPPAPDALSAASPDR
jgi:drug/metabolite transporter (DMT)-like permease